MNLCKCGCGTEVKKNWVHGHNIKNRPHTPVPTRFWKRVKITETCWLWEGSRARDGYAQIKTESKFIGVHIWSYESLIGTIPFGLVLDHLCRVRHCVNPEHLEPVTEQVNILRGKGLAAINAKKTHCKYGHPFSDDNLYVCPSRRGRQCRTCHNRQSEKYYNRKKVKATTGSSSN